MRREGPDIWEGLEKSGWIWMMNAESTAEKRPAYE
jgi:hypothetical protein